MAPIITKLRKNNATYYAYIPLEIVEKYGFKDGDAIGVELSAVRTEPLETSKDTE